MKRILAITLSLLMVFTFIPVVTLGASAEEATITSEAELANYLTNGTADTITFGSDITVTSTIYMSKAFVDTIDTAGFKFIFSPVDETVPCMIQLATSGSNMWGLSLDIKNSAATATEFVNNSDGKPLFINYTQNNNQNANRLNFRSGEFTGDIYVKRGLQLGWSNSTTYPIINGDIVCEEGGGTIYLNEGVINGNVTCYSFLAIKEGNASAKKEVNGDITATTGSVQFNGNRNVTVVGNINAATSIKLIGVEQSGGKITAGTSILVKNYGTADYQKTNVSGDIEASGVLFILSGTLNGAASCGKGYMLGGTVKSITSAEEYVVTAGTFTANPESIPNLTFKGDVALNEETGYYEVSGYAPIELNGDNYTTFADAMKKAVDGDTITLTDDYLCIPLNGYMIGLNKDNITVDLKGYDLTDLSDINDTGVVTNIVQASANITNFKLTSTGGKSKIVCNSSDGAGQVAFQFNKFNDVAPATITLENFDFMYTGGQGNNRTYMTFNGTSSLDNVVNFNNVTVDNNTPSNVSGTGCNGISFNTHATVNFTDCSIYGDRYTIGCYGADNTYNFVRTNIDAGKASAIRVTGANSKVNITDCDMLISRKQTDQHARLISTNKNTTRATITIDNSTLASNANNTLIGCESTTNYVGADVTITNSKLVSNGTGTILVPTTEDIYTIKNTEFVTKAASAAGAIINGQSTAKITVDNSKLSYDESVNSSSYPVMLAGTASLTMNDCIITGGRYAFKAASTNTIALGGMELHKYNDNYGFAVDATTAGVITLADGYRYYYDEAAQNEVTDFVWNTSKQYMDMYLINPDLRNISIDGNITKVSINTEFTFPESTDPDFKGYSDGEKLYKAGDKYMVTANASFTTVTKLLEDADFTIDTTDKTFTGEEIKPSVTSSFTERGYDVAYTDNTNVGTAKITITGNNHCFGTVSKTFNIVAKDISASDFTIDITDKTYTGEEIKPTVSSETLSSGFDYSVAYTDNKNVGTATITITGNGNFKGEVVKNFTITSRTITEADFVIDTAEKTFTGEEIKPSVTASKLAATDFEVSYKDNINTGDATITVAGKANCTGTFDKTFKILAKDIVEADFVIDTTDKTFTGAEIKPSVTSAGVLTSDDYDLEYSNNINVGEATITLKGKGNYAGTVTKTFNVVAKDIVEADFEIDTTDKTYTREEIKPTVTSAGVLVADADYEVSYLNNTVVGEATITVTGKGNYKGTVTKTFKITPMTLVDADFGAIPAQTYANEALTPAIPVVSDISAATDFDVVYSANTDVGTATATITGKGNYTGTVTKTFAIGQKTISDIDFAFDLENKIYTRDKIKPEVTSKKLKDADFEIVYTANIDAGTATITITGKGNCIGTITKTFIIDPKPIEDNDFTIDTANKTYTREEIKPEVTADVLTSADYDVAYSNNTDIGTAKITITGKGNYKGTIEKSFTIDTLAIADTDFTVDTADKTYTREEIKPEVSKNGALEADKDYTVSYSDNINVGVATITINGIGNYSGTITKTFNIVAKTIEEADVVVDTADKTFTKYAISPVVTSAGVLVADIDYTVAYANNVNKGIATITITGIGNYTGEVVKTFNILPKKIASTNFSMSTSSVKYTGKTIKKTIKSSLKLGTDYTVSYKNYKYVGTCTVTITGKGNYTGAVKKYFKIVKPTVSKTSKVTLKVSTKKLTASWKKVTGANGYAVRYSLKSSLKGAKTTYVSYKTLKRTIKSLKKGKRYYVAVAAYKTYKTNSGKTYKAIGSYKKVKSAKIK